MECFRILQHLEIPQSLLLLVQGENYDILFSLLDYIAADVSTCAPSIKIFKIVFFRDHDSRRL